MLSLCLIVESGADVRLVEGLAERFELSVLARGIEGGLEINHPPAQSVPVVIGPASRIAFARSVWKHLREHGGQFDEVIVQGYGLAALAANAAGLLRRTRTSMLVCSPVEAYYLCRKFVGVPGKSFRRRELFAIRALARLNALIGQQYIVLSRYLASVVRQHGARGPIAVIPVYGVDTSIFKPAAESKAVLKARLGLPVTGALIFFSSRIAPEKDAETLLEAVRILLERGRDIRLLHRSGGYPGFLKDAERFGVAQRVIADDAVHPHLQLPGDYQACDLCVQASRAEGLGFSPLEALACEVPVIATATGGLLETIIEGQTGWTYPAGDARALANKIEVVLDDPQEATRRAVAGREMVRAMYERRIVFEKLERLTLARALLKPERARASRKAEG
ncbi:MAG TPA: glycosyltransferase family 4 protein [Pyrinomonadaceae bacterium]|jgi:glycosyltransferase involved in cell wall biosynthesis|nr:glycosyltransferase family 4 protein [Pyrinomonadaceae bacterium]